jgi:mannosyltransferase
MTAESPITQNPSSRPSAVIEPSGKISGLILIGLVLLGTIIRLYGIESRGLYDEAASWTFARLHWPDFWKVMWDYEGHMVFYFVLLKGWLWFGDSQYVLRGLSVVVGVISIPALCLLGRRAFDKPIGVLGAAFLTVHAFHISWSQQARSYVLVTLLLILSTYFFIAAMQSTRPKKLWAAYTVFGVLAVYCHLLAVFVLASNWISQWLPKRKGIDATRFLSIWAALGLLTAPAAVFAVMQNKGRLDWVPPLTWNRFGSFLHTFSGSTGKGLMILYAVLMVIAVAVLFQGARPNNAGERRSVRLLVFWLVTPIALNLLLSLWKSIFVDHYMLMCLPPFLLLAAFGAVRLAALLNSRYWILGITIAVVFGLSLSADEAQYRSLVTTKDNWSVMTEHILSNQRPGDAAIFFTAASHMSFNYYANLLSSGHGDGYTPSIVIPDFGSTPTGAQPIPTQEEVSTAIIGRERVWLVLNMGSISLIPARGRATAMIRKTIAEQFAEIEEQKLSGTPDLVIVLYKRRNTAIVP